MGLKSNRPVCLERRLPKKYVLFENYGKVLPQANLQTPGLQETGKLLSPTFPEQSDKQIEIVLIGDCSPAILLH